MTPMVSGSSTKNLQEEIKREGYKLTQRREAVYFCAPEDRCADANLLDSVTSDTQRIQAQQSAVGVRLDLDRLRATGGAQNAAWHARHRELERELWLHEGLAKTKHSKERLQAGRDQYASIDAVPKDYALAILYEQPVKPMSLKEVDGVIRAGLLRSTPMAANQP